MSRRLYALLALALGPIFATAIKVQAQTAQDLYSLGIAENIAVQGENLEGGKIVTYEDGIYTLSEIEYDPYAFGVISELPAVEFLHEGSEEQTVAVVRTGNTPVQVSGVNGSINVGDRLTSSTNPGIAMLADKSGLSIGVAQEAYDPDNPEDVGTIVATIDIKFTLAREITDSQKVQSKLLDVVNLSTIAALEDPQEVLRYVLASFILVGSVAFSFLVFGRSAQNSILALGRNPLASKAISLGMILNIALSVFIIASGVATAWFVIRL